MADDKLVERLRYAAKPHQSSPLERDTLLAQAADRIEALMAERQWQPIETAPKDGTYIVLCRAGQSTYLGHWNGHSWDDGDFYDDLGEFTHWMPLPAPPAEPQK